MSSIDLRLALPDEVEIVGDRPVKIRCINPEHRAKDKQQSMAVYRDSIRCYGCNFALGCNREPGMCGRGEELHSPQCLEWQKKALEALLGSPVVDISRYTTESLDSYRERAATEAKREPLPKALAKAYQRVLLLGPREHRMNWLYARGLRFTTIKKAQLGHDGFRFTIPVFDKEGELLTIRYRRDEEYGDKRPKYCGLAGRNGLYLYPENWLAEAEGLHQVVVCEGELDALRLWQDGIPAVSATNGAGQVVKAVALLAEQFPEIEHLVFATDMDEPGEEAARLGMLEAAKYGKTSQRWEWEGAKDVTEALQLGAAIRFRAVGAAGRAA